MSPGEVAAMIVAVSVGIAVVGLLFTMAAAVRALSMFRRSVQEITRETLPLIADMHAGIKQANADLMKLDTVLDTAESISTTRGLVADVRAAARQGREAQREREESLRAQLRPTR